MNGQRLRKKGRGQFAPYWLMVIGHFLFLVL